MSFARFGEGEMSLLARHQNLKFQKYDEKLAKRMSEILVSKDKRIAIGIPRTLISYANINDQAKKFWKMDLSYSRHEWYKYTKRGKTYFDSLVTRCYIDYKDKSITPIYYENWKQIWKDRDVVIIEGEKSRIGVGNNLLACCKSIKRILCPATNAFSSYNEILNEVLKIDNKKLFLIALGPTAGVLAYDLAQRGYQAIDVGHIDIEYEWYLKGSMDKEKIENKFVNEVANGNVVGDVLDTDYNNSIIAIIH